jgi:hypothetical protein
VRRRARAPLARLAALALAGAALTGTALPRAAHAGDFDDLGRFAPDPGAVAFEDFAEPVSFVPPDLSPDCEGVVAFRAEARADALSGEELVVLDGAAACPERFRVELPRGDGSYRATVWMRHGSLSARMFVWYPPEAGRENVPVRMAPTGRATSDGWVELATNDFTVEGDLEPVVYLRAQDLADAAGVELDALEVVRSGGVTLPRACEGVRDPVCGPEAVCVFGACHEGRYSVPPLPEGELRDAMITSLRARLETLFGGKKTRTVDLPRALLDLDRMRDATTPWQFWNAFGTAVRRLHDWHTSARSSILDVTPRGRLDACFVEGEADLSHDLYPPDPRYADVLVSHAGGEAAGLRAGDRLLAVDGLHPIEWARRLVDVDWSFHVASDSDSFADFAEALGGPSWGGGALILKYARSMTILRCDEGGCGDAETVLVSDLVDEGSPGFVLCDNRPGYHLATGGPDPATHDVGYEIHRGPIAGTDPAEKIEGMVWDTLYGGGDPEGYVNAQLRDAVDAWRLGARGVILDHRAGNGGTLDAPQYLTELVRPPEDVAVLPLLIASASYEGPSSTAEGIELFERYPEDARYRVGSNEFVPDLPVALILHRDGSASDYLPYGMKGAPNVRLFAPGPTAGAFSTFIQFAYWGGLSFQIASGDTITPGGDALLGRGVAPDEIVRQRQSDLVQGKDTLHEAALAWVRANLRPDPEAHR